MAERTRESGGPFVERLAELLLLSYAGGQDVEGDWPLVNEDRMVPDLYVSIDPSGGGGDASRQEATVTGTDTRAFESKLESFLLRAFADGEAVAGAWELRFPRAELPAWRVEIELDGVDDQAPLDESTPRSE